ncbi:ER membrane protein complex subunit 10 [Lucilia cuprina]|nr:ER membrane protein complex subunit 10 [Lucilia cuprina]
MKVNIDLFLSSIFLLGLFNKSYAYLEFDGWISIELQHALNPNEQDNFSYRGNVSVPSLNSGLFNIAQNVLTKKDLDNLRPHHNHAIHPITVCYSILKISYFLHNCKNQKSEQLLNVDLVEASYNNVTNNPSEDYFDADNDDFSDGQPDDGVSPDYLPDDTLEENVPQSTENIEVRRSERLHRPVNKTDIHTYTVQANAISVSDGFYRLKAVVEYPNGLKRTFFTANKACNLLSSQLNDELWISIDANGYVNALSLSTSDGDFTDCSTLDFSNLSITEFNTEVLIKHTELAPIPDTASFIQKIEREREARERGENKDNRGFFAKYWMYIVPVVLLVFISGATNPEQQK